MRLRAPPSPVRLEYDQSSDTIAYLGTAAVGSKTDEASWRIKRITFAGDDVTIEFAETTAGFVHKWTERASLSYG
ncbi:MAG: hypothetical protein QNJ62_05110 [Methyloceanibacter sp.]|nr:hypothetical protein [Methyloceanibacter sp.]